MGWEVILITLFRRALRILDVYFLHRQFNKLIVFSKFWMDRSWDYRFGLCKWYRIGNIPHNSYVNLPKWLLPIFNIPAAKLMLDITQPKSCKIRVDDLFESSMKTFISFKRLSIVHLLRIFHTIQTCCQVVWLGRSQIGFLFNRVSIFSKSRDLRPLIIKVPGLF